MHKHGADVLVVSSGSIALGRTVLGLPDGALKLEDSQAAAAVGQIALARIWAEVLGRRMSITAGQILVTFGDTEERRRYLNARATIGRLLDLRAVPVINENDTVATYEIRYGDNDRLAARVATMASRRSADPALRCRGPLHAPPAENPGAQLIPVVPRVSRRDRGHGRRRGLASCRAAACAPRSRRRRSRPTGGTHMLIADGRVAHPVARIDEGAPCTWFLTGSNPGHRAQEMDRRLARTARRAACRRRRGEGDRRRQEPAARRA